MTTDPLVMLLRAALEKKEMEERAFDSASAAEEALRVFMETPAPDIKPGDAVERNEMGRNRYKLPGPNQTARCVRKIEPTGDSADDMVICVALGRDIFEYFAVDSRFYRVAGSAAGNVFKFKKKGE